MPEEILLVDDDPAMLTLLESILSGAGHACRIATDANQALAAVLAHQQVAVVVSDLLMPGLSGLQLTDRLNALPLDKPPPRVLLLTAHPSLEAAVDALRLGVRDFLCKPIRPPELIEAVERALHQARVDRRASTERRPEVAQLLRQAEALAVRLRSMAYVGTLDDGHPVVAEPKAATRSAAPESSRPAALDVLETIEQLRRLRDRYAEHKLDDVAWEVLLELLRAERLRQRLSVSGLTISISGVSPTTSLRRVNELVARGYIARKPDPSDARRDFVALTQISSELLADYLTRANAHLQDLPVSAAAARNLPG